MCLLVSSFLNDHLEKSFLVSDKFKRRQAITRSSNDGQPLIFNLFFSVFQGVVFFFSFPALGLVDHIERRIYWSFCGSSLSLQGKQMEI